MGELTWPSKEQNANAHEDPARSEALSDWKTVASGISAAARPSQILTLVGKSPSRA
jgi:hypothetical protein